MNSNGSILLDVLVSFFTCLLIASLLIPMLVRIAGSSDDAEKRITGLHLLYEQLKIDKNIIVLEEMIFQRKGVDYTFRLQNYSGDPAYMEGCISYVDSRNTHQEFCDITPKR